MPFLSAPPISTEGANATTGEGGHTSDHKTKKGVS